MPSRSWPSSASTIAASSSIERPTVPPAPAEFSSRSQVVSEQCSSTSRSAGHAALEPCLEARAEVRADVEDDAVRLDRAGRVDRRDHRLEALAVDHVVRRREVAEVERMHEHRADPRLRAALPEARQILLRMLGEPPRARALREQLHRVRPDLDRPVERALDPASTVGAEEHAARLTASCPSASAWLRAPPASSTSAASARSSSTGSSRADGAASACSGSRTPTRAARSRSRSSRSSARCAGSGSTGTATSPSSSTGSSAAARRRGGSSTRARPTRTRARSASACPTRARPAGTTRSRAGSSSRTSSSRISSSSAPTGGRPTTSPRRSRTGSTGSRT